VICDSRKHVGKPSLRINVVEFGRLDECVHHRCAFAAAVGASEQPRFATERDDRVILHPLVKCL
jgi:hypothetical protein